MLAPVVQQMQGLKREAADLETSCAEMVALRDATVANMEHTIDAYLAFMAQESDAVVAKRFAEADRAMDDLSEAYGALAAYK